MNGYELYRKAAARLGYTNSGAKVVADSRLLERAPELINQIAADLKITPIAGLSGDLLCDEGRLEALCCGLAMLLALSEGDGDKHKVFADIYNAKRAATLSEITYIEDRLPKNASGGI